MVVHASHQRAQHAWQAMYPRWLQACNEDARHVEVLHAKATWRQRVRNLALRVIATIKEPELIVAAHTRGSGVAVGACEGTGGAKKPEGKRS